MLETDNRGRLVKDDDGDVDYVNVDPTSEDSEKIFLSFSDLFNCWFSQDWSGPKKTYPKKIRLRIGDGYFVNTKEVTINIPKDAILKDSDRSSNDWDSNFINLIPKKK